MPHIVTKSFGEFDYAPEQILEFPAGLPAFEDQKAFVLIEEASHGPLVFLQSVVNPKLCFTTLPVGLIDPHYELEIIAEDARLLEIGVGGETPDHEPADLLCLAMLVATENCPTANLMAPVVINRKNRRAVQAIRVDKRYSHQYPLLAAESVCS